MCCCRIASEAQLGGESAGQRGFYLFEARIAFKGPALLMVSVCASVFSKSNPERESLFNEQ